jgi:hypothetical protein
MVLIRDIYARTVYCGNKYIYVCILNQTYPFATHLECESSGKVHTEVENPLVTSLK